MRRNNAGFFRHFTRSTDTGDGWITLVATDPGTRFDTEPRLRVPMKQAAGACSSPTRPG
jgi:hypothetical protein